MKGYLKGEDGPMKEILEVEVVITLCIFNATEPKMVNMASVIYILP